MNRIALMVLRNIFRVPWAYWKLCRYAKRTEEYPEEEKFAHIQYIFRHAVRAGNTELQVFGQENIPRESGYMFYANHQGLFDVIAIAISCGKPIAAVLKQELYNLPLLHQICLCTKSFALDRENARQSISVIQNVVAEVKKGRNYLIFPEGTRSKLGNGMLEFHSGSFRCATKSHCTIVPVALIDSYKVLDQKGCKPVSVQLHYLPPIYYEEYKDMNTTQLAQLVQGRIAEAISNNT